MPRNTPKNMTVYVVNNNKNIAIVLKSNSEKSLVWLSSPEKEQYDQNALDLRINDKIINFEHEGLKWVKNKNLEQPLITPKNQEQYKLNFAQQQATIKNFEKRINKEDPTHKIILLEMKNESISANQLYLQALNQSQQQKYSNLVHKVEILEARTEKLKLNNEDLKLVNKNLHDKQSELIQKNQKLQQDIEDEKNLNAYYKLQFDNLSAFKTKATNDIKELNETNHELIKKLEKISKENKTVLKPKEDLKKTNSKENKGFDLEF